MFTTASRDVTARTDAFFDTGGQTLLANLLLAAANAGRPLTQVYERCASFLSRGFLNVTTHVMSRSPSAQLSGVG